MLELVQKFPRYGNRRFADLLRRERWYASDTRAYRFWRREGLKVPQKKRKQRLMGVISANDCHLTHAEHLNHVWGWDFAFDGKANGTTLTLFSVIDEYTRESLALEVEHNFTSADVVDTLAELLAMRGVPQNIRCDNGPDFIANVLRGWREQLGVTTPYIEPGSVWKTVMPRVSSATFETTSSRQRSSSPWSTLACQPRPGSTKTTITVDTARSNIGHRASSRLTALLSRRLRLLGSGTPNQLLSYHLP